MKQKVNKTSFENNGNKHKNISPKFIALKKSTIFHKIGRCLRKADRESVVINTKKIYCTILHEDNANLKFQTPLNNLTTNTRSLIIGKRSSEGYQATVNLFKKDGFMIIIESNNIEYFYNEDDALKSGRKKCSTCCW